MKYFNLENLIVTIVCAAVFSLSVLYLLTLSQAWQ